MTTCQRPPAGPRLKERNIQGACADFLALDGWRPLATDPCRDRARGAGFGEKGMADHLFLRYHENVLAGCGCCLGMNPTETQTRAVGEILWVEFKRPRGRDAAGRMRAATKAQQHQVDWHLLERARGALTAIAGEDFEPSYDGFVTWYRTSGLLRRAGL